MMNCDNLRALLPAIRPDSRDLDQPEYASERLHLQQCAACQAYWEAQQDADRELTRAMRNVAVPADLKSRLLAQLSASLNNPQAAAESLDQTAAHGMVAREKAAHDTVTVPVSETAVVPELQPQPELQPRAGERGWTRRRAATVTSAALLLLAFGTWVFVNAPGQAQLTVNELLVLSHAVESGQGTPFEGSFQPVLPTAEINMTDRPQSIKPVSFRLQGREIGALYSYPVRLRRGQTAAAVLVVIDLQQVLVDLKSVGTSFQTANVEYPLPNLHATRVWRQGANLYVCYVKSKDREALEALKTQFLAS